MCYEAVVPGSEQEKMFAVGNFDHTTEAFTVNLERVNSIRKDFHVSKRSVCSKCFCRLS